MVYYAINKVRFKDLRNPAPPLILLSIFTLYITFSANAAVVPLTVSQHDSTNFITYNEKQVTIDAQNKTLDEVLQAVQTLSNINFQVSEEFLDQKVNRIVKATDWSTIVEKLLRGFNMFVLWDGDRMVQVFAVNSGSDGKVVGLNFMTKVVKENSSDIVIPSFAEKNSSGMKIAKIEPEMKLDDSLLVLPPPEDMGDLEVNENEHPKPPDESMQTVILEEMPGDLSENDTNSPVNSVPTINDNEISYGESNDVFDSVASLTSSTALLPPPD